MKLAPRIAWSFSAITCVAALYIRHPYAFRNPQFYAEEGKYFFAEAYNEGWASLFNTANGYFHLFPRLLANLSLTFGLPYVVMPAVFDYACLLIYLVLWISIFTRLQLPLAAKVFVVLSTVLVPLGNEIFMNQTNIQWVMTLFPVVLFAEPGARRMPGALPDHLILILCVFTGPYVLCLFPVFLLMAVVKGQVRVRAPFLMICFIGAAACAYSLVRFGGVDRVLGLTNVSAYGFVQFVVRQYYFPLLSMAVDEIPEWAVRALFAALLVGFIFLARTIRRSGNTFASMSFIAGLVFLIVTAFGYRRNPGLLSPFYFGIRNFYLPMVLLLWSVLAITRFDTRRVTAWTLMCGWFATQTVVFVGDSRRPPNLHWQTYAERIGAADSITIPITPPGWTMTLTKRPGEIDAR